MDMYDSDEDREQFKRYKPAYPRNRQAPLIRTRYHRSLLELHVSPEAPETDLNKPEPKGPKKWSKYFRWKAKKKSSPVEFTDRQPLPGLLNRGYIGNLGLGRYIAAESNAFVSCESGEDASGLGAQKKKVSRSMVDLSSITPWTSASSESVCMRSSTTGESDQDSVTSGTDGFSMKSESSQSLHLKQHHKHVISQPMPGLLQYFFYSFMDSKHDFCGTDTLTNADHHSGQRRTKEPEHSVPALFIASPSTLQPNVNCLLYHTNNYQEDLDQCVQWLEEALTVSSKPIKTPRRSPSAPRLTVDARARRRISDHTYPRDLARTGSSFDVKSLNYDNSRKISSTIPEASLLKSAMQAVSDAKKSLDKMKPSPGGISAWLLHQDSVQSTSSEMKTASSPGTRHRTPSPPSSRHFPILNPADLKGVQTIDSKEYVHEAKVQICQVPNDIADTDLKFEDEKTQTCRLWLSSSKIVVATYSPKNKPRDISSMRILRVLPLSRIWCSRALMNVTEKTIDSESYENILNIHTSAELPNGEENPTAELDSVLASELGGSDKREVFFIGWSLTEALFVQFQNSETAAAWRGYFYEALTSAQARIAGRGLFVRIINEVMDNQVMYKVQQIFNTTTVADLQERALEKMDIKTRPRVHMLIRQSEGCENFKENRLLGYENPFLLTLYISLKCITSSSTSSSTIKDKDFTPNSPSKTESVDSQLVYSRLEDLIANPPESGPLLGDERPVVYFMEFVLRAYGHKADRTVKEGRGRTPLKPSDVKKNHSGNSKAGKESGRMREKIKSSLFLASKFQDSNQSSLRGAQSMGALGVSGEKLKIFGRSPDFLWPDAVLPQSLIDLFLIVYYNGTEIEGIFRRSASRSQIEQMRIKVDGNLERITPDTCSAVVASCVLKRFFSEIPGHVLDDSKYDEWLRVSQIQPAEERFAAIEGILKKLPKVHNTLLLLLLYVLNAVREKESINLMSTRNLCLMWAPNLIGLPGAISLLEETKSSEQIAACVLDPAFLQHLFTKSRNLQHEIEKYFNEAYADIRVEDEVQATRNLTSSTQNLETAGDTSGNGSFESSLQSEASSVEEKRRLHTRRSLSSLLSTSPATSSSAESTDGTNLIGQSSSNGPRTFDERKRFNRRTFVDITLSPQLVSPISMEKDSSQKIPETAKWLRRSTSVERRPNRNPSPPPVPAKTPGLLAASIQMHKPTLRTEPVIRQEESPPVPPRVKARYMAAARLSRAICDLHLPSTMELERNERPKPKPRSRVLDREYSHGYPDMRREQIFHDELGKSLLQRAVGHEKSRVSQQSLVYEDRRAISESRKAAFIYPDTVRLSNRTTTQTHIPQSRPIIPRKESYSPKSRMPAEGKSSFSSKAASRSKSVDRVGAFALTSRHVVTFPVHQLKTNNNRLNDTVSPVEPRRPRVCVRRVSSHASTTSSGSATLVSDTNETQ